MYEMTRREFVATTLSAGIALAGSPSSAQNIQQDAGGLLASEIKIPVTGGEIPGYRAMPASGGPFPVVLVAFEIFGLQEHIKDICRRFAGEGWYPQGCQGIARILTCRTTWQPRASCCLEQAILTGRVSRW
jgi:carboxymethylenebutenolidase